MTSQEPILEVVPDSESRARRISRVQRCDCGWEIRVRADGEEFRVYGWKGLGFRIEELGFGVDCGRFWVSGLRFRGYGVGLSV